MLLFALSLSPASLIILFFFFNDTATTEIYTLSLHDALPISPRPGCMWLYSYPSILLSTSHQNGGAVLEQWGPVSQSPVGQEVTSLRTRLSTPPMLGLAVLVLTIVPAYLLSRPNATDTARTVVSIARSNDSAEAATDEFTAVEIEAHIRAVAIRYRIAPLLVAAIVEAESEFNPRAVSRKGARGLMQLMPLTASSLRVEDTVDPYKNIEAGVRHL